MRGVVFSSPGTRSSRVPANVILARRWQKRRTAPSRPGTRTRDSRAGFFLKIAGIVLVGGIIAMIACLIWWRAVYAWGFLGGFLAFAAVLWPVRLAL